MALGAPTPSLPPPHPLLTPSCVGSAVCGSGLPLGMALGASPPLGQVHGGHAGVQPGGGGAHAGHFGPHAEGVGAGGARDTPQDHPGAGFRGFRGFGVLGFWGVNPIRHTRRRVLCVIRK